MNIRVVDFCSQGWPWQGRTAAAAGGADPRTFLPTRDMEGIPLFDSICQRDDATSNIITGSSMGLHTVRDVS